jgi:glycosyltransferase involved in cell wall biosynthesis
MLEALALLQERGVDFVADIAGRGPMEGELREQAAVAGLDGRLRFHGFIADHAKLDALVASGSVALAPYADDPDSFTRFADPSKLKTYLAAGVPIVTTDVPPTAHELAEHAGAEVVAYDAAAFADAIERALGSEEQWRERRAASLSYARAFDWNSILTRVLEAAGFVT